MELFHGSYENTAPVIKVGAFAMSGDNVFDGLFASSSAEIAGSHGNFIYTYTVNSIADSDVLETHLDKVVAFVSSEITDDPELAEAIAWALIGDECDYIFEEHLSPRSVTGDASWEMQRLRGRVAARLGYDAVEMNDEHGTSYLIVNPLIKGE